MPDITSSDGHCTVRMHTSWASVLVWTDLTGTISVRRNGVDLATLATGRQIYYDHFYSPLGGTDTYTVTNGTTTSTGAAITIPTHPQHWTWLKSGVDPNLSLPIPQAPLGDISWPKRGGVFDIIGAPAPFVIEAGLGARRWPFTWWTTVAATRAKLLALMSAGPFYVQVDPRAEEPDMWATVRPGSAVQVSRRGSAQPNVGWLISAELIETDQPAASKLGNIIPGWGWDNVMDYWGTWDAVKAACPTWKYLVQAGVS